MEDFDLVLRIVASTLLVLFASVLGWNQRHRAIGPLGALYLFSIFAYLWCPRIEEFWDIGPVKYLIFAGCYSVPALFWMFAASLFDDAFRLRAVHIVALIVLILLGFGASGQFPGDTSLVSFARQFMSILIVVYALIAVGRGFAGDMVDSRRKLRAALVVLAGVYILLILAVELFFRAAAAPLFLEALNAATILLITLVFVLLSVTLRENSVFAPAPAARKKQTQTPADAVATQLEEKVKVFFSVDKGYRTEGLTITQLAETLNTPEHRLRRLINQRMGFRNFSALVNQCRIAEACKALADADQAHLPILTIALGLGYRSLAPFNRAFKEIQGQTPSEYRAENMGKVGPETGPTH
jgi:AraC-like DNA-binding protein